MSRKQDEFTLVEDGGAVGTTYTTEDGVVVLDMSNG